MNVFGGAASGGMMESGPRGPCGFRGKDSSMNDFGTWLPQTIINNLQVNDEKGTFFIENPEKDLIRKKQVIAEWVSRSERGGNFVTKKYPSTEIERIEDFFDVDRYAMKLNSKQHTTFPTYSFSPSVHLNRVDSFASLFIHTVKRNRF